MSSSVATAANPRTRFLRAFFGNFFSILVMAIAVSEWAVLWWLFPATMHALPLVVQAGAPLPIYFLNRLLAVRTQRRWRARGTTRGWLRFYYAAAFTSLFCAVFLLVVGALWLSATVFVGAIVAQAGTARAVLAADSTIDMVCRWMGNAGLGVIGLMFAYGYSIGQRRLKVVSLKLPLRHGGEGLQELRIAQISDIHIGQNLERAELARFVARVNALGPDLICITGDIADSPGADLETFLPILAALRARYGVFAILGNHDHRAGADHVAAALRRLTPFTVLRDSHTSVEINGHRLYIIGLDDRGYDWAHGMPHVPYLAEAMAAVPPDEPVLLLCHRPDIFPQATAEGIALTLAGHTHGGQLALPSFKGRARNLAEFITAFDRGLYECNGSYLYVNSGLGVTAQRIRLNAPREITLIEVQPATA